MLTLIDEHTRECLAIDVARSLKSEGVLERLRDLSVSRGLPTYIRSDNGFGVYGNDATGLVGSGRREDAVHRAGQSVGRMNTSRVSIASGATSFWRASSSIRCWSLRSSSSAGSGTSTPSDHISPLAIELRRQKRSNLLRSLRLRLSKRSSLALELFSEEGATSGAGMAPKIAKRGRTRSHAGTRLGNKCAPRREGLIPAGLL